MGVLKRKWQRFLSMFGERLQFDANVGPTLAIMRQFTSYVYVSREGGRPSAATQRIGCGDSYELQLRYMVPKYVFPLLGYPGWTELSREALHEKCEPYKFEVKALWAELKKSDPLMESSRKPFVKEKWCDTAYFLAQEYALADTSDIVLMVQRMSVKGFIRVTCERAGAAGKDWFDRTGQVRSEGDVELRPRHARRRRRIYRISAPLRYPAPLIYWRHRGTWFAGTRA